MTNDEHLEMLGQFERKKAKELETRTIETYNSTNQLCADLCRSINELLFPSVNCPDHTSPPGEVRVEIESRHSMGHLFWCPIAGVWYSTNNCKPTYVFEWRHGQEFIGAIFGHEAKDEMFSALNRLSLCPAAAERFRRGHLTLVPDINRDQSNLEEWETITPRPYRIKVINPFGPGMQDKIQAGENDITWNQLNGKPVDFKSPYRPRARYLYFHYCLSVLRLSWMFAGYNWDCTKDLLKATCWRTKGTYMKPAMLRAFMDELGEEAEDILEVQIERHHEPPTSDGAAEALLGQIMMDMVQNSWPEERESRNHSENFFPIEVYMNAVKAVEENPEKLRELNS